MVDLGQADLVVSVSNYGKGSGFNVRVSVESNSSYLPNQSQIIEMLKVKENKEIRFSINISETADDTDIETTVKILDPRKYEFTKADKYALKGLIPPKIQYTYQSFEDGSGSSHGNGDDIIQNGETVELKVNIKNSGQGNARDVKVRLTSPTNQIRMIKDTRDVGNIPAGESVKVSFAFEVLQSFKDDGISLKLVVNERHNMFGLTDNFALSAGVLKPALTFTHKIDDSSGGNGNSILEAGEKADLVIIASNQGKGDAIDVKVRLDTDSPLITEKNKSLGFMKKGAYQRKVTFPISIPEGQRDDAIKLGISLNDPRGYTVEKEINLAVKGMIPPNLKYRFTIGDDNVGRSKGNGNEKVENGEKIELRFKMTNYGEGKARNVELKARTDYSGIIMERDHVNFGEISPQESQEGKIVFSVPPDFKKKEIPIKLIVKEKYGYGLRKDETISVNLVNPVLSYSFEIEDQGHPKRGGYNGIIDPNETVDLKFKVKNVGEAIAESVVLQFYKSLPDGIRGTRSKNPLGNILPGGEKEGTLSIFVNQSFTEKEIFLPIKLSEQYHRGMEDTINLKLGSKQDLEVPTITVESPRNKQDIVGDTTGFMATITDDIQLSDDIQFFINQQPFTASDGLKLKKDGDKLLLTGNIPIGEGENSLLIVAKDKAGNKGTKRITVFGRRKYRQEEKLIPPEIRIAEPRNNQDVKRDRVKLLAFINDDKEISRYLLRVNGESYSLKSFTDDQKEQEFSIRGPAGLASTQLSLIGTTLAGGGREIRIEGYVELQSGQNVIELVAFDSDDLSRSANVVVQKTAEVGDVWALVVGISRYEDKAISQLKYADNDAQAFYDFLVSQHGKWIKKEHIQLLLNEKATGDNMRRGIKSFLTKALPNDLVMIYFAGHGAPEPGSTKEAYLIPYDARMNEIQVKGYPMRELDYDINKRIAARKVILIADACHSGEIGREGSRGSGSNPTNEFLKRLANRKGKVVFTASRGDELSQEDEKFGGGHGVFTHYLLEGLKGKADGLIEKDRIITLDEIFKYTFNKVSSETSNMQHPELKGSFDEDFPLAWIE